MDELSLLVDERIYSRECVLRACYWFTDRAHIFVERAKPDVLAIRIRRKNAGLDLEMLSHELENALLDQQVRMEIASETARIRELIVAKAFAEGDLLDDSPVGDDRDPVEQSLAGAGGKGKN